ncbi:AAA family ATPase [Brevibacterium otitidis]|uniref:ATP/GTP-binding protein n=1 Tax=Brevibacterium otitidis TaxID=53364 RepID=A0ABV5WYG5_9MICO|nr:ATP-binding protein [Brevibacterium otitidis]
MLFLSFTVRNHGSIRDEVTLDFTKPALRTLSPKGGSWEDATYTMAGVFGGNATGKSALLDAVIYFFSAIAESATTWQASKHMRRKPFRLDARSRAASSLYEMHFVYDGRRHVYGFEVDADGIRAEWLRDVPRTRWRTLLDRQGEGRALAAGAGSRGQVAVTPRELALSRARLLPASPLHGIAEALVSSFDAVSVKDSHREARLIDIADALANGAISFADLLLLLQAADIGVTNVEIEEADLPEHVRKAVMRFMSDIRGDEAEEAADDGELDLDEENLAQVVRRLVFSHRGAEPESPRFTIHDESDGTIAWLAIAVPALEVLRRGGLLVVDEIDASLHPHLLEVMLGVFADPEVNVHHAQLIFTSHESYILSSLSDLSLEPEQVWLTDKTDEGVTELTCLADFPKHPDANVARRYLTGRYGGIPRLSPSSFAALVTAGES